jgi:hypothetical protein
MRRTPDIREFKKEHLLEKTDLEILKQNYHILPCVPKEHLYIKVVNEVKKELLEEEEKELSKEVIEVKIAD